MKKFGAKRAILVSAILAYGTMGLVEPSRSSDLSLWFRGNVTISTSTAGAGEASRVVRRPSCTLVRHYVARYSAPAAEAWARSRGATDADIQIARRCISLMAT